jgi:hypothetical protein
MCVLENRGMRIFRPNTNEVTGGWGQLYKEEHNLHSSPNTIKVIKSMRLRWVGTVVCRGKCEMHTKFWMKY